MRSYPQGSFYPLSDGRWITLSNLLHPSVYPQVPLHSSNDFQYPLSDGHPPPPPLPLTVQMVYQSYFRYLSSFLSPSVSHQTPLPFCLCMATGFTTGWYPNSDSGQTGVHPSPSPTYPATRIPVSNWSKAPSSFRPGAGIQTIFTVFFSVLARVKASSLPTNFTDALSRQCSNHYAFRRVGTY